MQTSSDWRPADKALNEISRFLEIIFGGGPYYRALSWFTWNKHQNFMSTYCAYRSFRMVSEEILECDSAIVGALYKKILYPAKFSWQL